MFSVEVAGATTPVTVSVPQDYYYPVRIGAYNITHGQIVGTSDHIQFRIRATPEPPIPPSGTRP
ncbi:MAG: hypothetical protein R6W97_13350 [Thiobacillus sp.]